MPQKGHAVVASAPCGLLGALAHLIDTKHLVWVTVKVIEPEPIRPEERCEAANVHAHLG